MKLGTLSQLSSGDALAAGLTLRSLAHEQRPTPSAAAVLGRVGEWLVQAAKTSTVPEGTLLPLHVRASELLTSAMQLARGESLDAAAALLASLSHLALTHSKPRHVLSLLIDGLAEIRDGLPLPAPEASS